MRGRLSARPAIFKYSGKILVVRGSDRLREGGSDHRKLGRVFRHHNDIRHLSAVTDEGVQATYDALRGY